MKEIINGLITAVHRERYQVRTEKGDLYSRLKTGVYYNGKHNEEFPTIGDNVELEYNPYGDSLIVKTLLRKSVFIRKDPDDGRAEQVVAANFDYVFIMMSLNNDFNLKRLERYITASWQSKAMPVIVLTKKDVAQDLDKRLEQVKEIASGAPVYAVSSITGEGMENLTQYLEKGKTIVFLGSSGVGKSTFTNQLLGTNVMETGGIRESDSRGHHTTTYRQLFLLKNGAAVIDTPGMRELGMWIVNEGMEQSFADIAELASRCKFSNCTHGKEPGCAVQMALLNGSLSARRWKNYQKIQQESKTQAVRADRSRRR